MNELEPQADPILRTKLAIPPTREAWVPRHHLLARLDEALHAGQKLILVSAPAGYGKTSLLSAWARTPDRRVAWLSLSESERDLTRFLAYLGAALQTCGIATSLYPAAPAALPQPRATQLKLGALLNEIAAHLATTTGDLTLILDDYHEVAIPSIDTALTFLLDNLPSRMHFVVATRLDPALPLARLRARGEMEELRAADLAFDVSETRDLLTRAGLQEELKRVAPQLHARTEGWAAGLHLAVLSLRDRQGAERLVNDLAGTHRYIADYLLSEVLDRQPVPVQRFLLQTSILNPLCAGLCEAVLTSTEGAREVPVPGEGAATPPDDVDVPRMLVYLDAANLFLLPLDEERVWYRYHPLFRDLLQGRLQRQLGPGVSDLHKRASRWYEAQGMTPHAIDHALEAQDMDRAARLLSSYGETALMHSETDALLRRLTALPEATQRAHPMLDVWHGGALLFAGREPEDVRHYLERARAGTPDPRVVGAAAVFVTMMALLQGQSADAIAHAQEALALLPRERSFLYILATSNLGLAHMIMGDLDAAARAFESLVPLLHPLTPHPSRVKPPGLPDLTAIAASPLSNLAGLLMIQGKLHQAATLYRQVLEVAVDIRGHPIPAAGKALMGLGEVEREWDQLDAAAGHLEEGIALTHRSIEMGTVVGYVSLMAVRQAQGMPEAARDVIRHAREVAARTTVTDLDDRLVAVFELRLATLQGDLAAARRWIEAHPPEAAASPAGPADAEFSELEQLALARAYLALGETESALDALAPLETATQRRHRMRRVMEVWVLQALAHQARGDRAAALNVLARALAFGEPEGFVHTFVDAGEPMARLLYAAIERDIAPHYAGRLLTHFRDLDRPADAGVTALQAEALIEPLSEREIEVLALIAEGLTNAEIAHRLVITLSTVKGHTSNIYGKLGVSSRTQAVAKARALGLLPAR